ncbi:MAG: YfhO family protein, partial [Elusimicrobiota bacterium]
NVKYVSSFWQLPKDKFKPVKSRHINIYLNKKCLPRVAFSNKPVIIRDSDVFEAIDSNKINLLKEFVLSAILYNIGKQENVSISRGEVHITDYSVNEITINAISSKGGWVILSDAWYPGWKVYVNGRPEKIYKVNYFMRGLMIKEGNSQIRMIYRPFSFKLGLWISVVSFSAVLFMILYPLIFGNILNDLIGFLDTKRYF